MALSSPGHTAGEKALCIPGSKLLIRENIPFSQSLPYGEENKLPLRLVEHRELLEYM